MQVPERGSLVYLNFSPQSGHEQKGTRPAIVLSPKSFNQVTGFASVCPITKQQKEYPFEVALPSGLKIEGVILTDQLKNVDWKARELKVVDVAPDGVVENCLQLIQSFLEK